MEIRNIWAGGQKEKLERKKVQERAGKKPKRMRRRGGEAEVRDD